MSVKKVIAYAIYTHLHCKLNKRVDICEFISFLVNLYICFREQL